MLNIVEKVDDAVSIRNVLISVSDKSGLEDFVRGLCDACPGVTFYSTGNRKNSGERFAETQIGFRLHGTAGDARRIG